MTLDSNSSLLGWWLKGLGYLVPESLKKLFSQKKKSIPIEIKNNQLIITWPKKSKGDSQPTNYSLDKESQRIELAKRINKVNHEKYHLCLKITSEKGLRKSLRFPLNAETNLPSIIEFEIDRQTPFSPDQVYHGYQITGRNPSSKTLEVELNVIPRKQVDPQLAILENLEILPDRVELIREDEQEPINVLPKTAEKTSSNSVKYLNIFLILLAFSIFLAIVVLPFVHLNSAINKTQKELNELKKTALEVNHLKTEWQKTLDKQKFINQKIGSRRSVTMIIEELTRILPDDSWLTRLQIKGNTIRLQGESAAATSLIGIIEQSDLFKDARFQSPVTTNISTGNDRFQIIATLSSEDRSQLDVSRRIKP